MADQNPLGPVANYDYAENLIETRDNLAQQLRNETVYQLYHGPKPSYHLGDREVQWTEWRDGMIKAINDLNAVIAATDPYEFITNAWT